MKPDRAAGILLHPTCLPGARGAGDFGAAAYRFVDWLASAGQSRWQVLPLGPTGLGNSPYMSPSAFAGNLLLIDLEELAQRGWLDAGELQPDPAFDAQRVDFERVIPWRTSRLVRAARRFAADAKGADRDTFDAFCRRHAAWLDDYALFMAIADSRPGCSWCDWSADLARRDAAALREARAELAGRIAFHAFCQWRFFEQWQRLKAYANDRGIRIVGDLPIFVAHQSAEVWARPDLFEVDERGEPSVVAGVPPDYFSATGQRWGNPLYRWAAHAAEGYAWWIARIRHAFELADIVRIDHFRGFAQYWEIAATEPTAVNGRWRPGPGAALFDAIAQALGPLPIIAEDLGLITPDVVALRKRFGLPGMLVLQFAFDGTSDNPYLPHNHRADAVVYTGTHDNDTTAGWWQQAAAGSRAQACAYLDTDGAQMPWTLIRAALASVAATAIVPLQDVLGLGAEARMNLPGQPDGNWTWRCEEAQLKAGQAKQLAELVRLYGRA
ncbi:MAG TPA: 4-alpha-glucanotransferase [Burkholderiaceae bacterium]|nr:4-alpha-glucanotransferase [Burkholderiaceae bacterium]